MGEGLGKVAQGLARRAYLLGVEPEMVGVGEHLLQGEAGVFEASRLREALDVPERAQVEGAFEAAEAVWGGVLRLVPQHEVVVNELLLYALEGREPRSEEHTSELQSRQYIVCRLLLEKK